MINLLSNLAQKEKSFNYKMETAEVKTVFLTGMFAGTFFDTETVLLMLMTNLLIDNKPIKFISEKRPRDVIIDTIKLVYEKSGLSYFVYKKYEEFYQDKTVETDN